MLRLHDFEVATPATIEEAIELLASHDGAMLVAGGTDLVPKMKRRQIEPTLVVSLEQVDDLRGIHHNGDGVRIGALTTLRTLERDDQLKPFTAVQSAVAQIATPIIRVRATVGGNLLQDTRCRYYDRSDFWRDAIGHCMKKDGDTCRVATGADRCYASFCSDLAPALIVHGAHAVVAGETARTVPLESIYTGDGIDYSDMGGGILTHVLVTDRAIESVYHKLRMRGSFDFPEVGVAVGMSGERNALSVKVAVVGVASRVEVTSATVDAGGLDELAQSIFKKIRPMDTMYFPPAYRKKMVKHLLTRSFDELLSAR
jgi:4-hydroxybenzoyl-CoA reductase subunit beta